MAYVPETNSVIAYQFPGSILAVNHQPSIIAVQQGSVATVIVGGSISASFTPPVNQSVSGTVGASVIGHAPVVIVGGSVAVSVVPPANQSVSGTVQTDVRGSVATVIIGGSISASFTPPANQSVSGEVSISNFPATQPVSGSVAVLQGTDPWTVKSSLAGGIFPISGSVGAVVTNQVTVVSSLAGGIFPISGSVAVGNFPANQNVSGSVVAFQGGAPWANTNVGSVITVGQGSIAVNIIAGSIAVSVTPPANQSVSGTVQVEQTGTWRTSVVNSTPSSLLVGASLIGLSPVNVTNFPVSQNVSGSIVAFQGTNPWVQTGSVQGTVSVLGTVPVTQAGAWTVSVVGTVATTQSGTWATSIVGVPQPHSVSGVGLFNVNHTGNGSVIAVSIGSVIGVFDKSPSIVGTYAEDSAHTTADKGLFVLGVRNDTVASFAGANGEYNPFGHDSAGRVITKPFAPGEVSLIGVASTVNFGTTTPASIRLFLAPGAGLKNYITDFNISNTGAATTLVSFVDEDASVMGRTIAPAGGGSNHHFATPITTILPNKQVGVIAATATSVLHITLTGFKAP